jgi:FkbM family methyltransferase
VSIDIITHPIGRFMGFPNDYLFQLLRDKGGFVDDFLVPVIEKYVRPDSVCVDVGANLGYVSVYLSKRAKKVYSLEPQPVVYMQLCGNLFLNECFNVEPLRYAALSHAGSIGFAPEQSGWVGTTDMSDYTKIRSIGSVALKPGGGTMMGDRLDNLIHDHVDFIKIDAEGGDIDAILGATGIIERDRPVIVFEYDAQPSRANYGRDITDLNPLLSKHAYQLNEIAPGNFLMTPQ